MAMFEWKNKTDDQITKFITETHGRLESKRELYNDLHSTIVKIYRPRRYDILGDGVEGEQYGSNIFDQHPANALNKFVSGKIGYMVNRSIPWIQFVAPDARLMQIDRVKQYCQEAVEQILFAANRSNFYSSQVPHALDAHSIGTSVVVPMRDMVKDRVMFDVVHPRDSYVVTNKFGDAIGYHRTLTLTHLTAVELFGEENLPKNWFKKTKNGMELKRITDEQKFIWAVYPNNDRDESSLLPEDRMYKVFCVTKGARNKKDSRLVFNFGDNVFPIVWRSLRESGSDYGTSLCADSLTTALLVNKLGEKNIVAAHMAVEPPRIASKTIRASLLKSQLNPKSYTWVDDINREGVKTVMDRLNWPITDAQIARLHEEIDDTFFIRFFEMLSNVDRTTKTAFEVSQMMGEKATLMSTIVDTYEQESIEPHIEALVLHETEAGRMPEIPDELLQAGATVNIRYLGPLAQLQRTLLKSKGTIDAITLIAQLAQLDEAVVWKFDWVEIAEEVAIAQGMQQKRIKSNQEVEAIRQQVEQQRQLAQQVEMAEKLGRATGGLSNKPEEGSPTDLISQGRM